MENERPVMELDKKADDLLKDPKVLSRFVEEIGKRIAGERDTLAAILLHLFGVLVKNASMKTHLIVNSESSAGKSYICNQIRKIFPEDYIEYRTKITPEVLTYWHNAKYEPDWNWDGKVLYLEDVRDDVLNSPTFKVMASEGSIATVVIKQRAIDIKIQGSPIIVLTSADSTPNAEIINRFSIINLDETPMQTKNVVKKQIEIAINGGHEDYEPYFTEAIRKLVRCNVKLPVWLDKLVESFPEDIMRVRRDIGRFIDLVRASAVLHQNQREFDIVSKTVWATEDDYTLAREISTKISDAGGSYGLTHRLQKCYKSCIEYFMETEEYFSVKEIHKYNPIVSERAWYTILDGLTQRGLLKVDLRKPPEGSSSTRTTTTFYPASSIKLSLPKVKELIGNEVNEDNEVNEANEYNEVSNNDNNIKVSKKKGKNRFV